MNEYKEQNFLSHYQKLLFSERNADEFQICSIRRKRVAQMFQACLSLTNDFATCNLYEKNMHTYSSSVDDKSGVNNYADSIQTLLSCSQTECKQWKSSLSASSFNGDYQDCNSYQVNENDIEFLTKAWKDEQNDGKDYGKSKVMGNTDKKNTFPLRMLKGHGLHSAQELKEIVPPKVLKVCSSTASEQFNVNSTICKNYALNTSRNISDNNYYPTSSHNLFSGSATKNMSNNFSFNVSRSVEADPHSTSNPFNVLSGNMVKNISCNMNSSASRSFPPRYCSVPQNTFTNSRNFDNSNGNKSSSQNVEMPFCTARTELIVQNQKKWGSRSGNYGIEGGAQRKFLGTTRRNVMNKFVPPVKNSSEEESCSMMRYQDGCKEGNEVEDERLRNIDPKMIEAIRNEIMDHGAPIHWDDIAGLQFAKTTIQEIVVWPMLKPEIFTGLRRPPKGILLFGPPGTGKTLIGKCIASQSRSTFFSISASSLTSKWIGDGEKMVRALFAVARCHQPAVVFIDEIDSLLSQRSDSEHESSRRIKTEFLVQLDGATTGEEERILVVGATNRPQELDEAARRRLVKRLYIPLPDHEARCQIVQRLMSKERSSLTTEQINEIASLTQGYSGADVRCLCEEASMGPIRSMNFMDIQNITAEDVRPIEFEDFRNALKRVRASVSDTDLDIYLKWDKTYGSG